MYLSSFIKKNIYIDFILLKTKHFSSNPYKAKQPCIINYLFIKIYLMISI